MAKLISDADLEQIFGGSIVFNEDCTTCGRNCNDQYKVIDFDQVLAYAQANIGKKREKDIINDLVAMGLLVSLK